MPATPIEPPRASLPTRTSGGSSAGLPGPRGLAFLLLTAILGLVVPSHAEVDAPAVGGRLLWDAGDELEFIGDLWFEGTFDGPGAGEAFLSLDVRTAIERTRSDFTFDVRDLDATIETGWRTAAWAPPRTTLSVIAGQRGKETVDADGQAYVRYLGVELRSREFLHGMSADGARRRHGWNVAAGVALREREVDADAVVRSRLWTELPLRGRRWRARLDARLEGLVDGDRLRADVDFGPGVRFDAGRGVYADFFLHYRRARNPLGVGHSALLAGFAYSRLPGRDVEPDRSTERVDGASAAPVIGGLFAAGSGEDGRHAGRLMLRLLSPALSRDVRIALVVDANVLTASDTGDLFYRYHLGVEQPLAARAAIAGAYFYHRSNHTLAEPNDQVTSLNVLEFGLETAGWSGRSGTDGRDEPRHLEARARAGYLLDSSFGEDRRWHLRGGARWVLPRFSRPHGAYLEMEFETGDIEGRTLAAGLRRPNGWELRLEHRDDEQSFSADRTAWLLGARYGF